MPEAYAYECGGVGALQTDIRVSFESAVNRWNADFPRSVRYLFFS